MLKSYWWVGGPCDYCVSLIQILLFLFFGGLLFDLGTCWDRGLDLDLDQGLTIFIHMYIKDIPIVNLVVFVI